MGEKRETVTQMRQVSFTDHSQPVWGFGEGSRREEVEGGGAREAFCGRG